MTTKDSFFVSLANSEAPHKNISHICFDFDGVLIDSIPIMKLAWDKVCEELGFDIDFDHYAKRIGLAFNEILEQIGVPEELHGRTKEIYDREALARIDDVQVFDGVISALEKLKANGLKVTLATSKTADRTWAIINRHFRNFDFDFVTTPESVSHGRGKPRPDQLLISAVKVGVDPYNSLYVGDMEVDRLAAKRAGFQYVYAKWGYGELYVNNDIWFRSITDLVDRATRGLEILLRAGHASWHSHLM